MPDTFLRRSIVVALAMFALVAGGMAIRVAASWTAEAATLTSRPATAEQLIAELDAERALAQGLRARVTTMTGLVDDLRGALEEERARAGGEAEAAAALAAQLDAAEAKLAELQAALAAAPPVVVITEAPPPVAAAPNDDDGEDHEEEDDDGEEDDD